MNKLLPKTKDNSKGFTLIELLTVIAIIAILSTIGITAYSGVQKNARDAKRRGDIDAISKALEINKIDAGYQALASTQFGTGGVPLTGPKNDSYCINTTLGATVPTVVWTAGCTGTGWSGVASGAPTGNPAQFLVCSSLEGGGAGGAASVFCKSSVQ